LNTGVGPLRAALDGEKARRGSAPGAPHSPGRLSAERFTDKLIQSNADPCLLNGALI
jgi:hypothetical protein